MFGLGTGELVVIGLLLLFIVGPKKLPQLGSSLAQSIRNFRKALTEDPKKEIDEEKEN